MIDGASAEGQALPEPYELVEKIFGPPGRLVEERDPKTGEVSVAAGILEAGGLWSEVRLTHLQISPDGNHHLRAEFSGPKVGTAELIGFVANGDVDVKFVLGQSEDRFGRPRLEFINESNARKRVLFILGRLAGH